MDDVTAFLLEKSDLKVDRACTAADVVGIAMNIACSDVQHLSELATLLIEIMVSNLEQIYGLARAVA